MIPVAELVKDVVIPRPENVVSHSISLFVMAKNAESCIGRLLDNVGPYIDEVVLVLNDTTDSTRELVETYCKAHEKNCIIEEVTREKYPDFYILDTKTTYEIGQSLCGEQFNGPYTESQILAKWSDARNIGWRRCTKTWRLFLDADDIVLDPESIPGICQVLEEAGAEQGNTHYFFDVDINGRPRGSSYRERFVKNLPEINWIYDIHEVVSGSLKVAHVDGNGIVRDMRDSTGRDIRIPGRNFKVLYHLARKNDWEVSARVLVNLLMEVRHQTGVGSTMFEFAEKILELYLSRSTWPEERGWACCITGEMFENIENFSRAEALYRQSLDEHPGSRTAWLLSRVCFKQRRWQECIDFFKLGQEHKVVHQVLNDGPLFEDMTKILVAASYEALGQFDDALRVATEALVVFPSNLTLVMLRDEIAGRTSSGKVSGE